MRTQTQEEQVVPGLDMFTSIASLGLKGINFKVEVVAIKEEKVLLLHNGSKPHLPYEVHRSGNNTVMGLAQNALPEFHKKDSVVTRRILSIEKDGDQILVRIGIVYPKDAVLKNNQGCYWVACHEGIEKILGDAFATEHGLRMCEAIEVARKAGLLVWGTKTKQ